ncbi:MAG TPA: hypothetical protein PKX25_05020, partial [Microthrixaceae bacterium]|nr:hypothetical protein [Microthrixaceae bacterium]
MGVPAAGIGPQRSSPGLPTGWGPSRRPVGAADGPADLQESRWNGTSREYRYARAVRSRSGDAPALDGIIVLDRQPVQAARLLLLNLVYLVSAGSVIL